MRGLDRDVAVAGPVFDERLVVVFAAAGTVREDDDGKGAVAGRVGDAEEEFFVALGVGESQARDAV